MATADNKSTLQRMNELVWEAVPQFASQRLSGRWGRTFQDGSYLVSLWKYAFILPPIFFILGTFVGGTHITYVNAEVFTFSIPMLICMIIPSVLSGCLGFCLCLGYAIGDLFIYEYSFYLHQDIPLLDFLLKSMIPRLIPIIYLYFLLVTIPASGRSLALRLLAKMAAGNPNRKIWEPILSGLWAGLLTYGWVRSVPLLIRPVYAWRGQDMPGILPPLYESGWIISFIVAMGVMVRQFFDQVFAERKNVSSFQAAFAAPTTFSQSGQSPVKTTVRILLITILTTFLLSGLYTSWYDALLFGGSVLIATFLKLFFIPRQRGWIKTMAAVPFLLRFLAGIVICWLFYTYVATPNALHLADAPQQQTFIDGVFKNILYTMLVSMLYFVFIFPETTMSRKMLALTLFFLLQGLTASADNWNNLTNPNDVPPKEIIKDMSKVAIGVTIVGAAVLVAGRRGSEITASFTVTDATREVPGSISISFSGGSGPYTVTGIDPGGNYQINSTGDNAVIANVKAGDYDISFRDSKGNTFTARTSVGGYREKVQVDSGGNKDDMG
jgi:hypothetical protein